MAEVVAALRSESGRGPPVVGRLRSGHGGSAGLCNLVAAGRSWAAGLPEQADLAARCPGLVSDDLVAGVLSRRDGWLNPEVFFSVLRAKAEAAGCHLRHRRVTGFDSTGSIVRALTLGSGCTVATDAIVDAAGVHTLSWQLGNENPLRPKSRATPLTLLARTSCAARPWPDGCRTSWRSTAGSRRALERFE